MDVNKENWQLKAIPGKSHCLVWVQTHELTGFDLKRKSDIKWDTKGNSL